VLAVAVAMTVPVFAVRSVMMVVVIVMIVMVMMRHAPSPLYRKIHRKI